jgi:hypothetical protein
MELLREHGAQVGAKYYSTVQMTAKEPFQGFRGKVSEDGEGKA